MLSLKYRFLLQRRKDNMKKKKNKLTNNITSQQQQQQLAFEMTSKEATQNTLCAVYVSNVPNDFPY